MKLKNILISVLLLTTPLCAYSDNDNSFPGKEPPVYDMTGFAKGADIGWLTEMEKAGKNSTVQQVVKLNVCHYYATSA